jgi:hypothetical protein
MSEEQWIPHVIESPFFDGRGITIGFFKVTEAGRRLA